jgi:hypothetical protein
MGQPEMGQPAGVLDPLSSMGGAAILVTAVVQRAENGRSTDECPPRAGDGPVVYSTW